MLAEEVDALGLQSRQHRLGHLADVHRPAVQLGAMTTWSHTGRHFEKIELQCEEGFAMAGADDLCGDRQFEGYVIIRDES